MSGPRKCGHDVETAQWLLVNTDTPLVLIAVECGLADQASAVTTIDRRAYAQSEGRNLSSEEAHGEFESECPDYCGAQDTFYVGT